MNASIHGDTFEWMQ